MAVSRSLRRLLYLVCSLVLLVLALAPSQAKAGGGSGNGCPTPGDEIVYYSDFTYTNEVGSCASDCCNCTTCTCTGQITPYAVLYQVNWFWCG